MNTTAADNDNVADGVISPELRMVTMILDKLPVPLAVPQQHRYQGEVYDVVIQRLGLNPAMALGVLRNYGIEGIRHAAPTLFFWQATGAPQAVCDDYKQQMGERIFDVIQAAMLH